MTGNEENIESQEQEVQVDSVDDGISFSAETKETQEEPQVEDTQNEEVVDNPENEAVEKSEDNEKVETQQEQEQEDDGEEEVLVELTEEIAWKLLKDKKGLTQESLEELLTPKEQKKYAPEMEKFNEFIEKTGNKNYNDYLETQKDWSAEPEDVQLKSYLKLSNPDLTERQVERLFDKNYNTEGLDEEDDQDEILDRQIAIKSDLKKATEFFNKRKEEFNAVGGSDEYIPSEYREAKKFYEDQVKQEEEFEAVRESRRSDFAQKTEQLLNNNFKGFEISYGNEQDGFIDAVIKPENIDEVKDFQLDLNNLNRKFFDEETGAFKDPKGYHEAMYMANNYKAELHKARMAGRAEQLEINDKLSKNIQPDNIRTMTSAAESGISFTPEK